MRATVNAADLAAALKQSVAVGATTMPALQHALIATAPDGLVMETSDSEVWVRTKIPAQVDQEGSQLLRAELLHPVAAGEGDILIRKDGHINRGRSRFVIPGLLPSDWNGLETVEWQPMQVRVEALAEAMDGVAHAVNDDDMRAYLRGLHVTPGWAWCADSSSMALCRLDYDGPGINVPKRQVKRVRDMLVEGATLYVGNVHGGGAGLLRVDTEHSQLFVHLALHSSLDVVGAARTFRYEDKPVVLDRAGLLATVRRFLPFTRLGGGTGKAALTVVTLEATGEDLALADKAGQNVESIGHLLHESTPATGLGNWLAGIDARRLIQTLGAITTDTVCLHRPPAEGAGNRVWLVLPADTRADDLAHYISRIDL